MALDFLLLKNFRQRHPAWKLLCANNAPFIIGFLYQAFIVSNERTLDEITLTEKLEDYLYQLQTELEGETFSRSAKEYLTQWAEPENGWLRKFYKTGIDEAQFDLMPATEKAIRWLEQLAERQFVGTTD